jgi:hypothetical protein
MQTIYLIKNCYKCYLALIRLYKTPDLSTAIVIVDTKQAKILLLDKRVKKFPFIINTLPTSIGLIPKIAKVLPLEMFMMLKKFYENVPKNVPKNVLVNKPKLVTRRNIKANITTIKEKDGSVNIILNK